MAAPTAEELANMPLEELEAMVMSESQKLSDLLATGGDETIPAAPPMDEAAMLEEEMPDIAVSPLMNPEVPLDMLSPDIIQNATSILVEAGYLDKATSEMTPDLIAVLQSVSDMLAPGIYNLNNDNDLMEFVSGISNGAIAIESTGVAASGATGDTLPAGTITV
tara:strand:+ start:70 stop:561 length:492 start_codon:yes stop_codon:yes gene_type:complete